MLGDGDDLAAFDAAHVALDVDLLRKLEGWTGSQDSYTYALASTGASHLVSQSMIDAAIDELESDLRRPPKPGFWKGWSAKNKKELREVIGELDSVRRYPEEFSAEASGMDTEDMQYKFDERDYGVSPEEEADRAKET